MPFTRVPNEAEAFARGPDGLEPDAPEVSLSARLDAAEARLDAAEAADAAGAPDAAISATPDSGSDQTAVILGGLNTARGGPTDRDQGGGRLAAGTYRVNALSIPQSYQHVRGALGEGTDLKALAGAVCAVLIEGKRSVKLEDLTIDGNAKASHGLRLMAQAGVIGEMCATLEHVSVTNCDHGIDVATPASGVITQADKNLFEDVFVNASNVGMYVDAENGQQQTLLNPHFENNLIDIEIVNGGAALFGGQLGGTGTAIKFTGREENGDAIEAVNLDRVITEGHAVTIDGSVGWPRLGVTARGTTFGGIENVRMGVDNRPIVFTAEHCDFANGDVVLEGDDATFFDFFNEYREGATVQRLGVRCRHIQWNEDGLTIYRGNTVVLQMKTNGEMVLSSGAIGDQALVLKAITGQTGNILEVRDGVGTLMTSILANGELRIWPNGAVDPFKILDSGGNTKLSWASAGALRFDGTCAAASAPNNSIFRDSADNVIKKKDNAGTVTAI